MSLQLFVWVGPGQVQDNKIHYKSFTLNSQTYNVGDCVYLYPEDEQYPPYIARILAAFVDKDVQAGVDPHCIEVKWFERRVNLEPSTKGIEESEREVFELEDTDVNPIGCISGKCRIVKASCYDEALQLCGKTGGWFFCRGYFQQSTNSFVAYTPTEMVAFGGVDAVGGPLSAGAMDALAPGGLQLTHPRVVLAPHLPSNQQQAQELAILPPRMVAEPGPGLAVTGPPFPNGLADVVDDADDQPNHNRRLGHAVGSQQQQPQQLLNPPPAQQQPASKRQKATGRTCVECGTTTTPQWREGPMGPKTLCNACGVRYVRSQQKAAGQKRSSGGIKNGQGRPKELTPPRAQQVDRVTKRGTSQKAYLNAPLTNDPTSVSASNSV